MQHIAQPTHNRGHTLDLVITYGLSTCMSTVLHLAVSDHSCVFFNITGFSQQVAPVRTVRKHYLTSEVAANFIAILPAPWNSIDYHLKSCLRSVLDTETPLSHKTIKKNNSSPWKNDQIKHRKKIWKEMKEMGKNQAESSLWNTNKNDKSSSRPSVGLCEDFACHFRSKTDVIRSRLSAQQNAALNTSASLFLPVETLEIFVLVDTKTLVQLSPK